MSSETEVIGCPACKHLVRVPADWLGTQVQCPECQAKFRAPTRAADGGLTDSELLSAPERSAPAQKSGPDLMLLLPAFGLLVCGAVGALVNGGLLYFMLSGGDGGKAWALKQVEAVRKVGLAPPGPPEQQAQQDDADAERLLGQLRWLLPGGLLASAVVFAGGLSVALRWNYRLAQVGCVVAAVNFPHLCCVPGAVAGLWGLLMLGSDEGRAHFARGG